MGLVDLRTDLKSLRFGKDRIGGGNSNQPYIKSKIPSSFSGLGKTGGPDFLLRGGTLSVSNTLEDVSRLTQMFFDFKSPNGLLFTVKQNLLSRSNVKTTADTNAFNNGIYLPTSTIAQAGVNALGGHLNKQGIDPFKGIGKGGNGIFGLFGGTDPLGQPYYIDADIKNVDNNNLLKLRKTHILANPDSPKELLNYSGGPGSILGIGKTRIGRYFNTTKGMDFNEVPSLISQNFITLSYEQLQTKGDEGIKYSPKIKKDFRTSLRPPNYNFSNIPSEATGFDYENNNIETRVNLGNPGRKGNKTNYQTGKLDENGKILGPLDKINALPLYQSDGVIQNNIKNDLVKFRIGVIDNKTPSKKTYIHFRAFIDSMSDSYSSKWNSTSFVGRGEEMYRYNGFNRSFNLSWTVAAQSKQELIPMYQKLNYLASTCAPDYSEAGYMRGNLISLTIGGWFFEQVGFIEGITYDVPQESPWEIGIPSGTGTDASREGIATDKSVKEMPHIIRVTGFKFTPIQSFIPKIQKNTFDPGTYEGVDENFISSYGPERYIMLSSGGDSKVTDSNGNKTSILADNYGLYKSGEITDGNDNYLPIKK